MGSLSVSKTDSINTSRPSLAPAEFAKEIVPYLPELRRRAMRLSRDPALSDDMVQETCVRALRFCGQYQRGTNLRAWLMQVLYSVVVTGFRRSSRERKALQRLSVDPCAWTSESRFGSPEDDAPMTPKTRELLEALPCSFRSVIELVDLEEWTYREAAEQLGLPLGTVMSRLHRGRKMLGAQLAAAA
jgi:RNA polymerase sigma-70 factor (ECF subfamily)